MSANDLTCDAVKRDSDGRPRRCGALATWAVEHEGGAHLYLCDEHMERYKKARCTGVHEKAIRR
jgi:hypothetical protein